jgi:two-component system cell cycle sensor histidine kinase/response regulator CckA
MAKARILIVEDDNIIALELRNRLEGMGYDIVAVTAYGEEALTHVEQDPPDLVLMDIQLRGGLDGIEAAAAIQTRFNLPVVYLTTYADEHTLQRAKVTQPYGYIIKPFQERELSTTIEIALDKHAIEHELKERDRHFTSLLDNPLGYIIYRLKASDDPTNPTVTHVSTSIYEILGIPPEQSKTFQAWFVHVHPDDLARIRTANERIRRPPFLFDEEVRYNHPTRGLRWFHIRTNGIPFADDPEQIEWANGIVIDITERKQAEAAYHTLVDTSLQGLMILQNSQIVFANQAMANICGFTIEEIREFIWEEIKQHIHADDRDWLLAKLNLLVSGTDLAHQSEFRFIHKDGTVRWVQTFSSRIDYSGLPAVQIAVIDVTERKQAEAEKARLEEQIHQAQKLESIGRLAGGVAHDFNNMLSVILGRTELALLQSGTDEPLIATLEEIRKAAERSANLTRQLLAFARKQTISPVVLDLNDTIEGMLKMLRRLIGEDINLVWLPRTGLWPVKIDHSQVDQILANLCVNSRDAIAGVGTISIETDMVEGNLAQPDNADDVVVLRVSDTGCGMNAETLEHIFEPFFTTKLVGQGTGLGLSTVYGIVQQNHGTIEVSSTPGQGTTFTIRLPRYVAGSDQRPAPATGPTINSHETILLVEDEPAILEVSRMMLQRLGYQVLPAVSPQEALRIAGEYTGPIDLLMTDMIMPGMHGKELSERLLTRHPGLKCLFMSGYTADTIGAEGELESGISFIQKPFSLQHLAASVRDALAQTA